MSFLYEKTINSLHKDICIVLSSIKDYANMSINTSIENVIDFSFCDGCTKEIDNIVEKVDCTCFLISLSTNVIRFIPR